MYKRRAFMLVIKRMLSLNLLHCFLYQKSDRRLQNKCFKYCFLQWCFMLFILVFGYALSLLLQSALIQYVPANKTAIFLSAFTLIALLLITIICPFIFGYHYNKYATKQIDSFYKSLLK